MSTTETQPNLPDFAKLRERFDKALTPGQRAELGKRVQKPEDLAEIPALYRLFPGRRPMDGEKRVAFLLPFCRHKDDAESLGKQLAKADVSEARLFQVIRADLPNDLIQLRRLVQHIEPAVNWREFGKTLYYWNDIAKRRLLEDFFIAQTK